MFLGSLAFRILKVILRAGFRRTVVLALLTSLIGPHAYAFRINLAFWRPPTASDPCVGTPGATCAGGALFLGTLSGTNYMITRSNCTDSATPTCSGGTDTLTKRWASWNTPPFAYGALTGATSETDGPGNTTLLSTTYGDTDAAKYCENMTYAGHSDWFLPAKDELNLFYTNRASIEGLAGSVDYYWSSTDWSSNNAWMQVFDNGIAYQAIKTDLYRVRCVRRF